MTLTTSEPAKLPRGSKTQIRNAVRAYAKVRRYGVRGSAEPPAEYQEARNNFLDALEALARLGVPQKVVAAELGITRSAVSIWLTSARSKITQHDEGNV